MLRNISLIASMTGDADHKGKNALHLFTMSSVDLYISNSVSSLLENEKSDAIFNTRQEMGLSFYFLIRCTKL